MQSAQRRKIGPAALTALLATAVAVAVNLATDWKNNYWAWAVVGILTLMTIVLAILLTRPERTGPVSQSVYESENHGGPFNRARTAKFHAINLQSEVIEERADGTLVITRIYNRESPRIAPPQEDIPPESDEP